MSMDDLMQNEAFKEALSSAKSLEEVASLLRENGLDVTEKDLEALAEKQNEGELDENALEDVSGGMLGPAVITLPIIVPIIVPIIKRLFKR